METAATEDVGVLAHLLEEVGDEPRLADAGRAEQREEPAGAVGGGVLVVAPEPPPFAFPADERRLQVAGEAGRVGEHLEQPEGHDRLRLPLEDERIDRLDANCIPYELAGLGSDQHLATDAELPIKGSALRATGIRANGFRS